MGKSKPEDAPDANRIPFLVFYVALLHAIKMNEKKRDLKWQKCDVNISTKNRQLRQY